MIAAFQAQSSRLLVAEQGEIVDVAEIGAAAELARHELIEGVQVAVGPELRGEIADRQTPRPADGEQVVAGKAHVAVFVVEHAAAAGDDGLDQRHDVRLRDLPAEDGEQDRVIDRREMLHDVGPQDVAVAAARSPAADRRPGACPWPCGWRSCRG